MKDFTTRYSSKDLAGFLLPIILSELFQEFYNLINTAVVSRYQTYHAVAVIGTCTSFLRMQEHVFVSMTAGFGVYIAKCIGSKDREQFRRGFSGAVYFTTAMSLVAAAAALFARQILEGMNVSDELIGDATGYLICLLIGCFFIGMKNLLTCTIQGLGDTKFVSVLSMACVITHTGLVVFLVAVVKMGAAASALAVLLNNGLYAAVLLIYLKRKYRDMFRLMSVRELNGGVMKTLVTNGIAKSGMTVLVGIGTFYVQYALNTLPTETIAGYSYVNGTINGFFMQPLAACATAASVIAAQNAGCKNMGLLRKYVRRLTIIDCVIAVASMVLCFLFGSQMIYLLAGSEITPEVLRAGKEWFHICTPAYVGLALFFIYRNVLHVLENYKIPVLMGAIEMLWGMLMSVFFVPRMGFTAICLSIALSWTTTGILSMLFYLGCAKRTEAKWKAK